MKELLIGFIIAFLIGTSLVQTKWLKDINDDIISLRLEIATLKGQDNTINTLMKDIEREKNQ